MGLSRPTTVGDWVGESVGSVGTGTSTVGQIQFGGGGGAIVGIV